MNTPTPRTDAAAWRESGVIVVEARLSESLERELAAVTAELNQRLIDRTADMLAKIVEIEAAAKLWERRYDEQTTTCILTATERDEGRAIIANLRWQFGKCEGIAKGILKAGEFSPDSTPPAYEPLNAALAVSTLRIERDEALERVGVLQMWADDITSNLRAKDKRLPSIEEVRDRIAGLHTSNVEKDAQIVALRDALESSMEAWRTLVNSGDAGNWNPEEDAHIILGAKALSTPPPPIVPLADVKPLLTAIENTRHWHDTSYNPATNQTEGVIVSANSFWSLKEALAAFTAKYPIPLSPPYA